MSAVYKYLNFLNTIDFDLAPKRTNSKTNESKQMQVSAAGACLLKPGTPHFIACKYSTQNSVFPGVLV